MSTAKIPSRLKNSLNQCRLKNIISPLAEKTRDDINQKHHQPMLVKNTLDNIGKTIAPTNVG